MDHLTQAAVSRFVQVLREHYPVIEAKIYGSRARDTHHPDSDADVMVLLDGAPQRFLPVTLAMTDLSWDIYLETGIDISPLLVWREEWENPECYPNPALLENVAREGVRVE